MFHFYMKNNWFLLALFLVLAAVRMAAADPFPPEGLANTKPAAMHRLDLTYATFQKYGDIYHFDTLMLAALAWQESNLNPHAYNRAGGYVGIMQIAPAAARTVGIRDISSVDADVHAAAKYMDVLLARFCSDAHFDDKNRFLFGIASYNAGGKGVAELRREAQARGYDPDTWFDNVERVASRHEAEYVRSVYNYYAAYKLVLAEKSVRKEERKARGGGI
jgi:membrane-bound lytic murein transglycosylase MltF